jgi:TonB family protein
VAAAVGAYLKFGPGVGTQVALQPAADTTAAADSAPANAQPDTAAAQAPGDTGTAHAASATEPPAATHEPAASTREPARAEPPRTEPTPRTEPARAAAPPPRPTQPPGGAPGGPTGNLMISGNIPPGARIMVDGVVGGTFRVLPVGRHRIRIEAPGYRPYDSSVDVRAGQPNAHSVTMLSLAAAAPPRVAGPQAAAPGPPPAQCASMPSFGVRNPNHECYTNPPVPRADPVVAPPASCSGSVTTARLLIKVSATGSVELSSVQQASNCPAFDAAALAQANDMAFTPATKNGTPVIAWIHLPFRPAARP